MRSICFVLLCLTAGLTKAAAQDSYKLWDIAQENRSVLKVATLFTVRDVNDLLSNEEGLKAALDWCKKTGITHVYIESFRGNILAEQNILRNSRLFFEREGFEVSGCITPNGFGSTGRCYTNISVQDSLQYLFEYTASIFDDIIIDDFFFTNCTCEQCSTARGSKSWSDYRCDLMMRMSIERVLKPSHAVNPKAQIILKYPLWYEWFHIRGYDVDRETAVYDKIYVGTETRDWDGPRHDKKPLYQAYYIMRWLGTIGKGKTVGGWFDYINTTEHTYVGQAYQTVLADAGEIFLFCYGNLLRPSGTGPANVEYFRKELPGIFELAKLVRGKSIHGIDAPKPPNSDSYVDLDTEHGSASFDADSYIFDFVGMAGLPLVPKAQIDADAESAFYSVHALKDSSFPGKLRRMIDVGKPVLLTEGLAGKLPDVNINRKNVIVLPVGNESQNMLKIPQSELKTIRQRMLAPFGMNFDAPNSVALYLYSDNLVVVDNFNSVPVTATLEISGLSGIRKLLVLPETGNAELSFKGHSISLQITPRTLVALMYHQ